MALTKTPVCDFGKKAEDFKLKSIENKLISLNDIKGEKATLIMFICNHCPYVKAIIRDLAKDCNELIKEGVNSVAIMSNDTKNYPEDSFNNMIKFAKLNEFGEVNYLIDETQEIARKYGAVCTPDFFGYNQDLKLQYRGRFRQLKDLKPINNGDSDLKIAMKIVAQTQRGRCSLPRCQIINFEFTIAWSRSLYYTKAILLFESRFYENCPRDFHSKKVLAILYGNRCQWPGRRHHRCDSCCGGGCGSCGGRRRL